jgi:hypothetical protein
MQNVSMRRLAFTAGTIVVLVLSSGSLAGVPGGTPPVGAAELAQQLPSQEQVGEVQERARERAREAQEQGGSILERARELLQTAQERVGELLRGGREQAR